MKHYEKKQDWLSVHPGPGDRIDVLEAGASGSRMDKLMNLWIRPMVTLTRYWKNCCQQDRR
jgi:hypothetical protein